MAWRAFLAGPITKPDHDLILEATIFFYDDADPANTGIGTGSPPKGPTVILHSRRFAWPYTFTKAQIQADIVAEGGKARDAKARADLLTSQFPDGTTLPIP